jgi:hypothetical protein
VNSTCLLHAIRVIGVWGLRLVDQSFREGGAVYLGRRCGRGCLSDRQEMVRNRKRGVGGVGGKGEGQLA